MGHRHVRDGERTIIDIEEQRCCRIEIAHPRSFADAVGTDQQNMSALRLGEPRFG